MATQPETGATQRRSTAERSDIIQFDLDADGETVISSHLFDGCSQTEYRDLLVKISQRNGAIDPLSVAIVLLRGGRVYAADKRRFYTLARGAA